MLMVEKANNLEEKILPKPHRPGVVQWRVSTRSYRSFPWRSVRCERGTPKP